MSACTFTVSAINPNEAAGGVGCLCHSVKPPDQAGPFAVFHATGTDVRCSPHVVLCIGCAEGFVTEVAAVDATPVKPKPKG
jgi:hypothetical protein